jgi:hypothetical protein
MEFKPDWEEAKAHHVAWWNRESLGRPTLSITAPRLVDIPEPDPPSDPVVRWTDPDYRISAVERRFARTYWGGDTLPYFDTNIGPGSLGAYIGCPVVLDESTVWFRKVATNPAEVPPFRFDEDNFWWRANRLLIEEGMRRGEGRYLTSIPDLVENLDVAASLMGGLNTQYALIDDPEGVKRIIDEINEAYFECYDLCCEILDAPRLGTCFSAFQIWGPGRVAKLQCDASAMISPEMFDDVVIPGLNDQIARLDCTAYHLDGPDAVCHLDSLIHKTDLNAIQWTPGSGQPGLEYEGYLPMYERILDAGKGVLLLGVPYDDVEPLARRIGRDGVYIGTMAPSIEAADELVRKAPTW